MATARKYPLHFASFSALRPTLRTVLRKKMIKPELKSFVEVRNDLKRIGIARFYHQAVKTMILRMIDNGVIKGTELEVGKKYSEQKKKDFLFYNLFKQMLDKPILIDAYLLEEPLILNYGTKTIKNKAYRTVEFYPESFTKTVRIMQDLPDD